jgi:hypothetical protein
VSFAYDQLVFFGLFAVGSYIDVITDHVDYAPGGRKGAGQWAIDEQMEVSCDTATMIIEQAKRDRKSPPAYNFITDCHWYTRTLMSKAYYDGTTECPP